MQNQTIIISDLDNTLLDENYSFSKAKKALDLIKRKKIPLVFCSSKNRSEIEIINKNIGINHPIIVENGAAIFIPKNYFKFDFKYDLIRSNYKVIRVGKDTSKLVKTISENFDVKFFRKMSDGQLAKLTGLSKKGASIAKLREFDDPFISKDIGKIERFAKKNDAKLLQGVAFSYVAKGSDKGKAVKILLSLYKKKYSKIKSVGLGDSKNDFPMLDVVDTPILIPRKSKYASKKYNLAKKESSAGWNESIVSLLS